MSIPRQTQILEAVTTAGDGVDVYIQDQTTPPFHFYLMREDKTDIGLTVDANKDDTVLNLTTGHGFTAPKTPPDYMVLWEGNNFEQVKVIGVSGDQVTIDAPLPSGYTTAATIIRGLIDLDLDGSTTPVEACFHFFGSADQPIDIIGGRIAMLHSSAGDRSKYGNLTALSDGEGSYFRHDNGITINLGTYQNNQDFEEFGWEVTFDDKAGGGNYATTCTIDLKQKYGIAKRIDPGLGDFFCFTIRADLTGLNRHRIALFGQYTLGE
jgi:hypothetical protein